jgi:Tfp pilus assembly protein PilP
LTRAGQRRDDRGVDGKLVAAAILALVGCGNPSVTEGTTHTQMPPAAPAPAVSAVPTANLQPLPPRGERANADFKEAATNRDPFRPQSAAQEHKPDRPQFPVAAEPFDLEQLKVAGIVTRGRRIALLEDPNKLGWIVQLGAHVGKNGNWQVDRIDSERVCFLDREQKPSCLKIASDDNNPG